MTLLLERLQSGTAIVDGKGLPTPYFMTFLQKLCDTLEANDLAQGEAIEAIEAAQAAADAADAAAAAANAAATVAQAAADDADSAATTALAQAEAAQALAENVETRINNAGIPP